MNYADGRRPRPVVSRRHHGQNIDDISPTRLTQPFAELCSIVDSQSAQAIIRNALQSYLSGEYETALERLRHISTEWPGTLKILWPYIEICERVSRLSNSTDKNKVIEDRRKMLQTLLPAWLFGLFYRDVPRLVRCKYCALYTTYINPNESTAGFMLDLNSCERCGRMYPMPSILWDSIQGMTYSYYRQSIQDGHFDGEFERRFEIRDPRA